MAIILLLDQTEKDQVTTYLTDLISNLDFETFDTPIELLRPDKPFCHIDSSIRNLVSYLVRQGHDVTALTTYLDGLETTIYDRPLWSASNKHISSKTLLELAPIGSWTFVLEGSSVPEGKFMTQATKIAIPSNTTPAILPANLHIVAMTFINETDGANEDLNLYLNGALAYVWSLTGARWGVITSDDERTPLLALPERGLLSAEIVNTSSPAAKDGILTIYFRLVGETTPGQFISPTL